MRLYFLGKSTIVRLFMGYQEGLADLKDRFWDAVRQGRLEYEFKRLGIKDCLSDDLVGQLQGVSLNRLRKIYPLATGYRYGAIEAEFGHAIDNRPVSDVADPSYQYEVGKGTRVLTLHCEPFFIDYKSDTYVAHSMFLGAVDLLHLIQDIQMKQNCPPIIDAMTNPTMAQIAINRFGFHPYEGLVVTIFGERRVTGPAVLEMLNPRPELTPGVLKESIALFMKGEDFVSDDMVRRVGDVRDTLYRRLSHNRSAAISPDELNRLEKQARIIGIDLCVKNGTLDNY